MSDLLNDSINVINGKLIVGNYDSITLLGVKPQNKLIDYSKNISKILIGSNTDLDVAMSEMLCEIENFQTMATARKISKPIFNQRKAIIQKYNKILSYLETVTLYFKLQQAQLIKEIKVLEHFDEMIAESKIELEKCIEYGTVILQTQGKNFPKKNDIFFLDDEQDNKMWFSQLEKRIDNLKISHAVSIQNQAQIKLLYENNKALVERIKATITNTIPIWQNQMSIILEIDLLENRLRNQNKVLQTTENYINRIKKNKRRKKVSDIDFEKAISLNKQLKIALEEMKTLENIDENIRKDFHILNNYFQN